MWPLTLDRYRATVPALPGHLICAPRQDINLLFITIYLPWLPCSSSICNTVFSGSTCITFVSGSTRHLKVVCHTLGSAAGEAPPRLKPWRRGLPCCPCHVLQRNRLQPGSGPGFVIQTIARGRSKAWRGGASVNKTAKPVCAGRKHHQTRHAVHALSAIHPVCGTRDLVVFGSLFSPVSMLRIAMLKVPAISFAAV